MDSRGPMYFVGVARFLASRHNAERYSQLLECVRAGTAGIDIADEADKWVVFAESMVPVVRPGLLAPR